MNKYHVTEMNLYLCEIGDGEPQWQLSRQEKYVLNRKCLGRWTAKDEDDLINQIEDFIGHPIETMTYKTNNVTVKYPRYEEVSDDKK
tara:strand:- start:218 stop:478 length:261 start_codon:yes stop_codon:yes gene_type:complete